MPASVVMIVEIDCAQSEQMLSEFEQQAIAIGRYIEAQIAARRQEIYLHAECTAAHS